MIENTPQLTEQGGIPGVEELQLIGEPRPLFLDPKEAEENSRLLKEKASAKRATRDNLLKQQMAEAAAKGDRFRFNLSDVSRQLEAESVYSETERIPLSEEHPKHQRLMDKAERFSHRFLDSVFADTDGQGEVFTAIQRVNVPSDLRTSFLSDYCRPGLLKTLTADFTDMEVAAGQWVEEIPAGEKAVAEKHRHVSFRLGREDFDKTPPSTDSEGNRILPPLNEMGKEFKGCEVDVNLATERVLVREFVPGEDKIMVRQLWISDVSPLVEIMEETEKAFNNQLYQMYGRGGGELIKEDVKRRWKSYLTRRKIGSIARVERKLREEPAERIDEIKFDLSLETKKQKGKLENYRVSLSKRINNGGLSKLEAQTLYSIMEQRINEELEGLTENRENTIAKIVEETK